MLRSLHLKDVGPAPELKFEFAPRLNLLTGDNGLGKTLVLDIIWWAFTWTWAAEVARPSEKARPAPQKNHPHYLTSQIDYSVDDGEGTRNYTGRYTTFNQVWMPTTHYAPHRAGEGLFPGDGIVLYARADGGFAVWDSYRNLDRLPPSAEISDKRRSAFLFDRKTVWDGLSEGEQTLCNGLIRDWVSWQQTNNSAWRQLSEVLQELSGEGVEGLKPGAPTRVKLNDVRDIPTLDLVYGNVPVTHASAGMRRICALAYMIVWAWQEHRVAAQQHYMPPTRDIIVLIDEVEAHLHPLWQRRVLPALMRVLHTMSPDVRVQAFAATHSPMVLASVESLFNEEIDNLYHFSVDGMIVSAEELSFAKQGDAGNWLVSESFGLRLPRSIESQRAIDAALAFMAGDHPEAERQIASIDPAPPARESLQKRIHRLLMLHVPGHDDFWPTWIVTSGKTPTKRKRS